MKDGLIPAFAIIISFLLGILFGCSEGYRSKQKEALIEACEKSKGAYDFCQKKIETKEYYVIKESK